MWKYIVYSLRIRRVEYRVAELPIFLIPMFLTIDSWSAFGTCAFWEGLAIFFFLFAFGDLLNCLADRDLDSIYKPQLSDAVRGIGVRGVILQAALSAAAALVLAAHLSWKYDRWLLLPGAACALFVAYAYSVPPLRLKGRGLGQLAFYWLGLFAGPMIYTAMLFRPWPRWDVMAVSIAYGFLQTGVILINTAEDFPEDRQMSVRTVIVAVGLRRGIALACVLAYLGSLGLLSTFVAVYHERHISFNLNIALFPLTISCVVVTGALYRLWRWTAGLTEIEADAVVKRAAKWVPLWITAGALTTLLAAVAAFVWRQPSSAVG